MTILIRTPQQDGSFRTTRSRNLRGILEYARRNDTYVARVEITHHDRGVEPRIEWANGAVAVCEFADYRVCKQWVKGRHSWRGAILCDNGVVSEL